MRGEYWKDKASAKCEDCGWFYQGLNSQDNARIHAEKKNHLVICGVETLYKYDGRI